ncbi:MAG: hypothetical protein Q7K37_02620 [Dehalococcoidia bacterium]|nr:hypothetical protein [Dehalococcoidia bacterium]
MVLRAEPSPTAERRLRALLSPTVPAPAARRLGVEHEYAVYHGDRQVDFREYLATLGFPGRSLHPTNTHSILTPSGLAVMADGWVAETASPPERLRPGAPSALDAWAERGRELLERHLPAGLRLHPGSTHLSVETRSSRADQICLWFAQTFAPALMLLIDRTDSPGILVRPRPHRFEVGGEFVDGERLQAAVTFLAGAVIALERAERLPPAVEVVVEPARQRYGWYVDRTAFGPDLYAEGRTARLRLRGAGATTAQEHLEACWRIARDALGALVAPQELTAVDRMVRGETPLPCEDPDWAAPRAANVPTSEFGRLTAERPGLRLHPVSATWDYVAFEIATANAHAIVNVPYEDLAPFRVRLEAGALDEVLRDAAAEARTTDVMETYAQTGTVGVFGGIRASDDLLPRDRVGIGPGTVSTVRPGKLETPPPFVDPPPPPRRRVRTGDFPWVWAGIAAVSLVLIIGGGRFLLAGGEDPEPEPTTTSTPTPAVASETPSSAAAVAPPVVGPIMAELVVPVTTYRVEATSPAGLALTYRWFLEADAGQDCGMRVPANSDPTDSPVATWSHANAPAPDDCHHDASDHPFHVRIEVSDGVNPPVIRTYEGSNSGTGPTE